MTTQTGFRFRQTVFILSLLAPGCAREGFGGDLPSGSASSAGGQAGAEAGAPGGGRADASAPTVIGDIVSEPADEATFLFDQDFVRTYRITVDPGQLAFIDEDPAAEQTILGTLEFEGKTYDRVGFRYKGSYGAFLAPCTAFSPLSIAGRPSGPKTGKCSMKLVFDVEDDDARFFGLKKLNLHSMNNDRSMLRERLGYALFREFGVASPRAVHARVIINGKLEGLFVAIEQIDDRFTRSRFVEGGEGNLYKEVWPMFDDEDTYLKALESNKKKATSAAGMVKLKHAAASGSSDVESLLDRDYTIRYLAADRVLVNDDGAAHWWCTAGGQGNNPGGTGNHNYYWYEAASSDRLWIIPWDMDSSLSAIPFVRVAPEWRTAAPCECAGFPGQRPTSCDPLFAHWASWHGDYEAAVDRFIAGPLERQKVDFSIALMARQIESYVADAEGVQQAPTVASWRTAVGGLASAFESIRQNRGAAY